MPPPCFRASWKSSIVGAVTFRHAEMHPGPRRRGDRVKRREFITLFQSAYHDEARPCVLSCPAMVSIRTVCRHCLANAGVCPTAAAWGDHTGETMAKLLNELGRGKPAIPPSFTPCPLALADRDRREALRDQQSLTATFFGDPLPGMSALDRRERERPH